MPSRIPAVLDSLVTALQAAPALSDVEVTDGPVVSDGRAPDWVSVGYDGDQDGSFEAAVSESAYNDLYTTRGEQITIPVCVSIVRGETDVREPRNRAFEIHDALTALFESTPGIAGPQTQAAIGSTRMHQTQTDDGVEVRLALAVVCNTLG